MEFGHLEGVPQPDPQGTYILTKAINHLLNKMILQVQIYGLEILDHISILGYLLGMLPCLLTTYTSWDDPYAPGCRLLDLSLRAAAKQESDVMG